MINIKRFCFNPMQTNCYVVNDGNHAIIIDPCCYFDNEKQELDDYITSNNFKIEHIFVTHMHTDHILGLNWCQKKYGIIAEGPDNENHWVEIGKQWAKQMGYNIDNDISPLTKSLPSSFISCEDGMYIEVIPTPGHSPGHLSYAVYEKYNSFSSAIFSGDVVFKNGIGRYDFPDSNYEDLQKSIETVERKSFLIYPGHGESFTSFEINKPDGGAHDSAVAIDYIPDKEDNKKKSFLRKLFGL